MQYQKSSSATNICQPEATTNLEEFDDEPEAWSRLSGVELMEAWYSADQGGHYNDDSGALNFEMLFDEANKGNAHAQYTLGKMYLTGVDADKNSFGAAVWFSRASSIGYPFATYELAKMFQAGIGVEMDPKRAADLFERSYDAFLSLESKNPNRVVEIKLASMCENRLIHLTDSDVIIDWREKSQKRGELIRKATRTPTQQLYQSAKSYVPDPVDNAEPNDKAVKTNPIKKEFMKLASREKITKSTSIARENHESISSSKHLLQQDSCKQSDLSGSSETVLESNENSRVHPKLPEQGDDHLEKMSEFIKDATPEPSAQIRDHEDVCNTEDGYSDIKESPQIAILPVEPQEKAPVSDNALSDQSNTETPQTAAANHNKDDFSLHEVISKLISMNVHPGDSCAALDGDRVVSGVIDRIEIYSNAVLVSVEIDDLRRPYPVSEINQTLFVGDGFISKAEEAARENG